MALDLTGKTALITGASQGIGSEIAKRYVLAGANVMLFARSENLLIELQQELIKSAKGQKICIKTGDVRCEQDVLSAVAATLKEIGSLHILVNNAGVYGPKGNIEEVLWDEWRHTIEVNLFGSVFMCRAVLPHFKTQKYGKIIQLSGGGATQPMPFISAYAASKAAIVRFSESLAQEVKKFGVDVNSVAPGALNTAMLDEILAAGPDKVGQNYYNKCIEQQASGGGSFIKATDLLLFLASSVSDGITGKLISAVWDNWENWPLYKDELSNSDYYTLRRIVDRRGLEKGDAT